MDFISIPTNNLPYKKMVGYLKSLKINPELIAVSISDDGLRYVPIDWKNYLPFGHKVVKIIFSKIDNYFLFVGYSKDDNTIIYNNVFSQIILEKEISPRIDQTIDSRKQKTYNKKKRIDILLDKIGQFGISSLSNEEKKKLKELSKK